jgi:hypothetical protein
VPAAITAQSHPGAPVGRAGTGTKVSQQAPAPSRKYRIFARRGPCKRISTVFDEADPWFARHALRGEKCGDWFKIATRLVFMLKVSLA